MKPKPFESLNHFTVPVAMSFPLLKRCSVGARHSELRFGHDVQGVGVSLSRYPAAGNVARPIGRQRVYCRGRLEQEAPGLWEDRPRDFPLPPPPPLAPLPPPPPPP